MKKWLTKRIDRLFFMEGWRVLVLNSSLQEFLKKPKFCLENCLLHETKDRAFSFYADPFLTKIKGVIYLIYEGFSYITKRGFLEWIALGDKSQKASRYSAGYHMSFPCPIEIDGKKYIIPESSANNSLDIYEFDGENLFGKVNLKSQEKFIDTVVYKKDDLYYIFTSRINNYRDCILDLYYCNNLSDDWKPHPSSPIKTGFYGSRMAGSLIESDGKLIRPGQISEKTYGDGIAFYEIQKLSEAEYLEEFVSDIRASEVGFDGIHHISVCENMIAIDVKKHKYSPLKLLAKGLRRLPCCIT